MRIVIAPDKFKGTLDASEVARAMTEGARVAAPQAEIVSCPLADGGEGTSAILSGALGAKHERAIVEGPLGPSVEAHLALLSDGSALVESATASGLHLVPPDERDALRASTRGTGSLIREASKRGKPPSKVVVAVGGTASTEGGTGAAAALGWRFLDERGAELEPGGAALRRLARIVVPQERFPAVELIAACDVDAPLTGPGGAARVFAPQKGASTSDIEVLEEGLARLAHRVREDVGVDLAELSYAGAGGGLAGGLFAFLGADLVSGFGLVARALKLPETLDGADLVITGEGRLDTQSLLGKCVSGVAGIARERHVSCGVVAGEIRIDPTEVGADAAVALVDLVGAGRALSDPAAAVRAATSTLIASMRG
ncbi:MAG: glycerate kinase [Actinomycetota bacterium]|nr:glycerate kinase [Actinomycetota bacterium]